MEKGSNSLLQQKCVPCNSNTPLLSASEISDLLNQLNDHWKINTSGHLYRQYIFKNFLMPVKFVNLIAAVAEEEGHHPDLAIGWGYCNIEIWTHKINGLTPSDFYMAAKIEKVLEGVKSGQ
jgi:4a-hydroxytetrahydrobiopterin dehydratase